MTLHTAAALVGGEVHGGRVGAAVVTHWTFDSRLPAAAEGNCFLCLPGARRSGVDYVDSLLERGVRLFCVSAQDMERLSPKQLARGQFWVVPAVLPAVQALAAHHRDSFGGVVVGITGSNGKTIVKEWLHHLLTAVGLATYRSPASHNSQLGVALSVLHDRDRDTRVHLFEAGVSKSGEMAALQRMIRPDVGLLTNVGSAHDDGFGSREEKALDKARLFQSSRGVIYDRDDPALAPSTPWHAATIGTSRLGGLADWSWSATSPADGGGEAGDTVTHFGGELVLDLAADIAAPITFGFPCPFTDAASRQNLTHALVSVVRIGLATGCLNEQTAAGFHVRLRRAIPGLTGLDMRLQVYAGRGGHRVIDDSYTADRDGLRAAAEFFSQQRLPGSRGVWLLGALAEEVGTPEATEAFVEELAGRFGVDEVRLVGRDYPTTEALIADLRDLPAAPTTFLVKGPRAARFDLVAGALREQAHGLRLEISLPALAHNVAAYRTHLRPSTKICVMVKAEAYGAGGPEVAAFFEQRGVDYLAVATIDEGVAIRRSGVRLPIIVAGATAGDRRLFEAYALEPEVTSLSQARWYLTGDEPRAPIPVHLKLDTGMHRLGFDATRADGPEFEGLLDLLRGGSLEVASVFSHLSASDDPAADDFTRAQHNALGAATERIATALGYRPMMHLLNSVGAWRLPEMQHDMVRLGLGVYGLGLEALAPGLLEPAHRWVAQLSQIRDVPAGEVVGYNLGGRSHRNRRIGVVNVGYADGLRRSASDGAYALLVAGRRAPIVGSVCMDFTMVDLADAPHAAVGDDVLVFGAEQPVQVLAKAYGTIVYEVFTGIGSRVRRVFYR